MTPSTQNSHIAQSNLRFAPYLVCVAGVAVIVLAFIAVAAALGALTFAVQWIGVRRNASLGFIGT